MQERIKKVIHNVIADMNSRLPDEKKIDLADEAILFGMYGKLDSLGLVIFITSLEQEIEEAFDRKVLFRDEEEMTLTNSPFRNIGALSEFIGKQLER